MKLYINDKYIHILKSEELYHGPPPDMIFDSLAKVLPHTLHGLVLLTASSKKDLHSLLTWIEFKKLHQLHTVVCQTEDYDEAKIYIKSQFRIIKAAGGLVKKGNQFLMMKRLGKWDLPKGKLDKGEKARQAAEREVWEECQVEVRIVDKLCTTWHTYIQEGRRILKKTSWFNMECLDDSQMEPQYVENIDELKWLKWEECHHALKNSYRSIRGVFDSYKKHNEEVNF